MTVTGELIPKAPAWLNIDALISDDQRAEVARCVALLDEVQRAIREAAPLVFRALMLVDLIESNAIKQVQGRNWRSRRSTAARKTSRVPRSLSLLSPFAGYGLMQSSGG